VAVVPVGGDGRLGKTSSFIQFTGKGVNPARQEAPHAHSINLSPDGRYAIAADLGLDQLRVYHFDPRKGTLSPNEVPFARTNPGAGPRHFVFRPDGKFVYVVNELQSSVTTFRWDAQHGTLREMQTVSALPTGFQGVSTCAEIRVHPNGKFVYASNRGHDSLAVFTIDARSGALSLVQHVPTGGRTPRNFALDPSGKWLFAENQDSGSVVIFKVDGKTGQLMPSGESLKVPSPVCLRFLALD
jgi:6-phosphogluconolactonase